MVGGHRSSTGHAERPAPRDLAPRPAGDVKGRRGAGSLLRWHPSPSPLGLIWRRRDHCPPCSHETFLEPRSAVHSDAAASRDVAFAVDASAARSWRLRPRWAYTLLDSRSCPPLCTAVISEAAGRRYWSVTRHSHCTASSFAVELHSSLPLC